MPVKNGFTPQKIAFLTEHVHVQTRKQLVDTTETLVGENQQRIAGRIGGEAPFQQWVDGILGKPLPQAEEYTLTEFQFLTPIVDEAFRMLIEASPVGPEEGGHYRDDHRLYVNGTRVDVDSTQTAAFEIMPDDIVRIVNMRPYARKIERGFRHSGRSQSKRRPGLSVQAPNGVYEIVASELRSRFGGIASIIYIFASEGGANDSLGGFPALEITGRGASR